jgi:hypothetical protein
VTRPGEERDLDRGRGDGADSEIGEERWLRTSAAARTPGNLVADYSYDALALFGKAIAR